MRRSERTGGLRPSGIQVLICIVLGCCLLLTGCKQQPSASPAASAETTAPRETAGTDWVPRKNIETLLLMGLDKFEAQQQPEGYLNDQQCDFLMLLILDSEDRTCQVLHLNRDTMTEIRRLGIGGGAAGRFQGQLALSHTFGSGGSDSCLNTVRAVSDFLKGVKIDHYLSMTMDAVGILTDLAGGIPVTIPVDMTSVDESFREGEQVLLHGDQALKFVRSRSTLEDSSNLSRMERQRQYLTALVQALLEKMNTEEGFLSRSLLELSAYIQSDLSAGQLNALGERLKDCELQPFVTIEGEAVRGEEFMEFYADEDSLNQVLRDLFTEQ